MGDLQIHGVEVTQAIQHYRAIEHLTPPAGQADPWPDNSARLVSGKPAWVRVYLRSPQGRLIAGVTGTIRVQRTLYRSSYGAVRELIATLQPHFPATAIARFRTEDDYHDERRTLASTLNFLIPGYYMHGDVRLDIRVHKDTYADERRVDLDVSLRQTLRLAGIFVAYDDGAGVTLPAPTEAQLRADSQASLTIMPVRSTADYHTAGTVTCTAPPASSPEAFNALWQLLWDMRTSDGNRPGFLYHALVPLGFPSLGNNLLGAAWGGVSMSRHTTGMIMAHELAHLAGRTHPPCAGSDGDDADYPRYAPYPSGSIGEYGLDINTGGIFPPSQYWDFMSICPPRWISPYQHERLINNPWLNPETVNIDWVWVRDWARLDPDLKPERFMIQPWGPDPIPWRGGGGYERLISVTGIIHSDKEIEVRRVARLYACNAVADAEDTDFIAELIAKDGKRLSTARLRNFTLRAACGRSDAAKGDGRTPRVFQAFLQDVGPGAELRIRLGADVVWRRRAPKSPPRLKSFRASRDRQGRIALKWTLQAIGKSKPEIWLQWSKDPKTPLWSALAVGLAGGSATVASASLPSGTIFLRLLVHDGFFTTASAPAEVEIPAGPPVIAILHPRGASELEAGATIRLWGNGRRSDGEAIDAARARWLIDGEEVARGALDVFVAAPKEGEHRLSLVIDGDGQTGEASSAFRTVDLMGKIDPDR